MDKSLQSWFKSGKHLAGGGTVHPYGDDNYTPPISGIGFPYATGGETQGDGDEPMMAEGGLTPDSYQQNIATQAKKASDIQDYKQGKIGADELVKYYPGLNAAMVEAQLSQAAGGEVHMADGGDPFIEQQMSAGVPLHMAPGSLGQSARDIIAEQEAKRRALEEARTKRVAELPMADKLRGGYEAFRTIQSSLGQGIAAPFLGDYAKQIEENMPLPETEAGVEYLKNVGEFLEPVSKFIRESKVPDVPVMPELWPFSYTQGVGKQIGNVLTKTAGKIDQAIPEALKNIPVGGSIKPKGGNWWTGQVEKRLEPLKQTTASGADPRVALEDMRQKYPVETNPPGMTQINAMKNLEGAAAINEFIDRGLTNYIKNEMGTPNDPIRNLADENILKAEKQLESAKKRSAKEFERLEKMKAEGPRPGMPPGTYENALQQQQGRAQRIIDDAQEVYDRMTENALPTSTEMPILWAQDEAKAAREKMGFPRAGHAKTEAGKAYEVFTDRFIQGTPAGEMLQPNYFLDPSYGREFQAANPWINKVDPETMIYRSNQGFSIRDAGFDHIIDELKNAMNPNSGLPAHLQLTPEQVASMGMEKATRHVNDINLWRSEQKSMADIVRAQKSAVTYKEYPETQKKLRWVELKPSEQLPEGWKTEDKNGRTWFVDPEGKYHNPDSDPRLAELEDALKYEGEVMQHCVGGYCPDVIQGKTRIFSLRDAKGKPNVTIEVIPPEQPYPVSGEEFAKLDSATKAQYREYVRQWRQRHPEVEDLTDKDTANALAEAGVPPRPPEIRQIKGKGNRKPKAEFIPFIQDFIKSQKWSDIKDLGNTDLVQIKPEFLKNAQDLGHTVDVISEQGWSGIPLITKQEFNRLADLFGGINKHEAKGGEVHMASGGAVQKDQALQNWHMAGGGIMDIAKAASKGVAKATKRMSRAEAEAAGYWHPISETKLAKPITEYQAKVIEHPEVKMLEKQTITPEEMQGGVAIPLVGDRAAAGRIIKEIEGTPMNVALEGGPDFMRLHPGAGWASGKGVLSMLADRIKMARESGNPIYGVYTAMSPQAVDFNTMMTESLLNQLDLTGLRKSDIKNFNQAVKEVKGQGGKAKAPNFPGIDDPELREKLLAGPGGQRDAFVKAMSKAEFQKSGFPDVAAARLAVTEPELLDVSRGTSGYTIAKLDPEARIVEQSGHTTYPLDILGDYAGGFEQQLPVEVMYPSHFEAKRLMGSTPTGAHKSLELFAPLQYLDQNWLDNAMQYLEMQKKLTGQKQGGLAQAEI